MATLGIPISDAGNEILEIGSEILEIGSKKLNSWLIENMKIMEELTIAESSSWREIDTPG